MIGLALALWLRVVFRSGLGYGLMIALDLVSG